MPSPSKSTQPTTFSSSFGFYMALAGSAIGLGNMWKFPYEIGRHGGGAFLLLYLACLLLLGYPLVLAEVAFGRHFQKGLDKIYAQAGFPRGRALGGLAVVCAIVVAGVFYNLVTGWLMSYWLAAARGVLTEQKDCPAFFEQVSSDVGGMFGYVALATGLIGLINAQGIQQGIERAGLWLTPLLFVLLIGLTGYAATLPTAQQGLAFLFYPRWSTFSLQALCVALSQSFISLGVGPGILITYGSYMRKQDSISKAAGIVILGDTLACLLAGLFLFPLIFHYQIDATQGPELIFVTLPLLFEQVGGWGGYLLGLAFFSLLLFAAFTSWISIFEVVVNDAMSRLQWSRGKATWVMSLVTFSCSIPNILGYGGLLPVGRQAVFTAWLFLCTEIGLPLSALLFNLFIVHGWGLTAMLEELGRTGKLGKGHQTFLRMTLTYFSPLLISLVLLANLGRGAQSLLRLF